MADEIPLELIPKLTKSEIDSSANIRLTESDGQNDYDLESTIFGYFSAAEQNALYRFVATEGSTYSFLSMSFHAPFLRIYDAAGNPVAVRSDEQDEFLKPLINDRLTSADRSELPINTSEYEFDYLHEWRAPHTGTFFVKPGWSQDQSNPFFSLSIDGDTDTSYSNINDLFDYGEETYPDLFPEHQNSQNYDELGYYARFYSNGFALGEKDGDIYLYDGNDITLIGSANDLKHLLVEDAAI